MGNSLSYLDNLLTVAITVIDSIFHLSFVVCRMAYGVTVVETNYAKNRCGILDKLTKLWTKLKGSLRHCNNILLSSKIRQSYFLQAIVMGVTNVDDPKSWNDGTVE